MTILAAQRKLARASSEQEAWRQRLLADAELIDRHLSPRLRSLHGAVVSRARDSGAQGLILTGSTARGRRTEISDLDYHLIGPKIDVRDLSHELDVHVLSQGKLEAEILAGDDFVQWSLRYGCVVFDDGALRAGLRLIVERRPWPDAERKRRHAARSVDLARRVVETGDEDGALVQVRTAMSLAARAFLLARGTFPLSRAELPDQLQAAGRALASGYLDAAIHRSPSLAELGAAVREAHDLLQEAMQ